MIGQFILMLGASCQITINFKQVIWDEKTPQYSALVSDIEMRWLLPQLEHLTFQSIESTDWIKEWYRLCKYLDTHIATLTQGDKTSYVFAPHSSQFTVQALSGYMISETQGSFTIRFMIAVGYDPVSGTSVYSGFEGLIKVSEIVKFTTTLTAFLSNLEIQNNLPDDNKPL